MNQETGEIKEFNPTETVPKGWVDIAIGDILQYKGCSFRIHRINPAAGQVILVGISSMEATLSAQVRALNKQ